MSRLNFVCRTALVAGLALAGATVPATAQVQGAPVSLQQDQTQERLERVERQLRDLQGAVYSVERPQRPVGGTQAYPAGATLPGPGLSEADISVRVLEIEQSLAQLTGRVEELAYRMERQQEILERLEGMGTPEFGAPGTLPAIPGAENPDLAASGPTDLLSGNAVEPAPQVALPDDPDRAFDLVDDALAAADYDRAESLLEAFVEKFPEAPQTADAKFTLGEIYLATGANGEAARVFLDHVSTYKDDPKSPEAYLKLGIAFKRLNRPEEACRVFNAGVKKFPNMEARLATDFAEERAAASCN